MRTAFYDLADTATIFDDFHSPDAPCTVFREHVNNLKGKGSFTHPIQGPILKLSYAWWPSHYDFFSYDLTLTNQQARLVWQPRPRESGKLNCADMQWFTSPSTSSSSKLITFPSTAFLIFSPQFQTHQLQCPWCDASCMVGRTCW